MVFRLAVRLGKVCRGLSLANIAQEEKDKSGIELSKMCGSRYLCPLRECWINE
jgi:hypothetical protein